MEFFNTSFKYLIRQQLMLEPSFQQKVEDYIDSLVMEALMERIQEIRNQEIDKLENELQ